MNVKITPAQLDEIEATARAATGAAEPSDWKADVYPVTKRLAAFEGQTTGSVDRLIECDGVYGTMDGRVATHIATFDPPTVLALIARLREAEAKVERATTIARRFDKRDPMWRDMRYAAKVMRALEEA